MRRGLDEVSGRRKIEPRARGAASQRAAKIERGFVRRGVDSAESKLGLRRIVRRQLPGRIRRGSRQARRVDRRAERGFDRLPRYRARTQQLGPIRETGDDRRLETMAAWPSVEDPVDPAVEIGGDVSRGRRAHGAGSVGGGRREGDARRLNERTGRLVRRRANRHRLKTGARQQADPAGRSDGQDQRERPRPERAGQRLGLRAEDGVLSRRRRCRDTWAMSGLIAGRSLAA